MVKLHTLQNGIRLITNKTDGVYSVSLGIFVGAGSRLETNNQRGLSHFIEHVTFKGTQKRTAFDISADTEKIGADLNAYTTRNMTSYFIKCTNEHTDEAFELLSDVFLNSVYEAGELEKEKSVIIQEINMYDDSPEDVCTDLLMRAYFGDNGYGAPILGEKSTVSAFTRDDVINYRNDYYTSDNIVISCAGAIDEERIIELAQKYFGSYKKSTKKAHGIINTTNLKQSLSVNKPIAQAHIALGFNGLNLTDNDVDAFNILIYILGGGMSSRLFQTVREKLGLCYSVYSFMTAYTDCGFAMIYAGVDKTSIQKAYEAIINELRLIKQQKITDEEFTRAFEQIKSALVFTEESVSSKMQLHAKRLLLTGSILDFGERFSKLQKITKDHVNGLIDGFLDINSLSKAVVGKAVKPL